MNIRHFVLTLMGLVACQPPSPPSRPSADEKKPTAADAASFAQRVNEDLQRLWVEWGRAEWVKSTYITDDTELLAADAHEEVMEYTANAIKDATKYGALDVDPETKRMLTLLRISQSLPSPSDEPKRKRLAEIASKMESMYGKGKVCKGAKSTKAGSDAP